MIFSMLTAQRPEDLRKLNKKETALALLPYKNKNAPKIRGVNFIFIPFV